MCFDKSNIYRYNTSKQLQQLRQSFLAFLSSSRFKDLLAMLACIPFQFSYLLKLLKNINFNEIIVVGKIRKLKFFLFLIQDFPIFQVTFFKLKFHHFAETTFLVNKFSSS